MERGLRERLTRATNIAFTGNFLQERSYVLNVVGIGGFPEKICFGCGFIHKEKAMHIMVCVEDVANVGKL